MDKPNNYTMKMTVVKTQDANNTSNTIMSRMALNDNKAGMEGLDKEKINHIIYEASKGSKFYENERKKEELLNLKIKEQNQLVKEITPSKLQEGIREADTLLTNMCSSRDLSHTIVHVDMDAFYAAVEMRDDPRLRDRPMAVGGMGMLSTSNYIARRYGVRAAMPGFIALKLCPDLIMIEPNFTKYTTVSQQIRQVFDAYDPNFCPMSLDEAYLDFTNHLEWRVTSGTSKRTFLLRSNWPTNSEICGCDLNIALRPQLLNSAEKYHISDLNNKTSAQLKEMLPNEGKLLFLCTECQRVLPEFTMQVYGVSPEEAVLEMRNRIEQRTQLTASAGIAPNTMLAKVCSDKNKPNGQFRIHPSREEVTNFISNLPIRKISGIGKVTEKLLGALGVAVCSDLHQQRAALYHLFSPTSFHYFMRISLGLGSTTVENDGERKSMSTERTFSEISDPEELYKKCQELSESLAEDLLEEGLMGKTVSLKIKTVSFELKTRSQTLQFDTNDSKRIFQVAKQLLKNEIEIEAPRTLKLRLMGVRMSKLSNVTRHQTLTKMFHQGNGKSSADIENHVKQLEKEPRLQNGSDLYFSEQDDEDFSVPIDSSLNIPKPTSPTNIQFEKPKNLNERMSRINSKSTSILQFVSKRENLLKKEDQVEPSVSKAKHNESVEQKISFCTKSTHSSNSHDKLQYLNRISCPICGKVKDDWPLDALNSHIDSCLISHSNSNTDHTTNLKQSTSSLENQRDTTKLSTDCTNKMVSCPICGQQKRNWQLDLFNSHVDLCLNKQTIRDIIKDENSLNNQPSSSSTDQEKTMQRKRPAQDSPPQPHRANKSAAKRLKGQPSLLTFFK